MHVHTYACVCVCMCVCVCVRVYVCVCVCVYGVCVYVCVCNICVTECTYIIWLGEGYCTYKPVQGLRWTLVCWNGKMRTVIQLMYMVHHTDELK